MRNAILGKLLNILHQTMYGVNWRVNITILAISQSFPKCSDFNICAEKLKQKRVIHQLKTKERVLLILSEASNNFNVYNYTSTPVTKYCNLWVHLFGHVANLFFKNGDYKLLWCQKMSQWKRQISCENLESFRVWKFELLKNRYLLFENLVFKLIWSRKRHMWGILW